jgi:PIN domain nuclease of toxin-antitoxin system
VDRGARIVRQLFRAGINYFRDQLSPRDCPHRRRAFQPSHRAHADRILIATARELAATLVTRDREMLAYGERGMSV